MCIRDSFEPGAGYLGVFEPQTIVRAAVFDSDSALTEAKLQGVFAFDLSSQYAARFGFHADVLRTETISALLVLLFLIALIMGYTVPEQAKSKTLPARRGLHTRSKAAASIVIGIACTAIVPGVVDVSGLNPSLTTTFSDLDLLNTSISYWLPPGVSYHPNYGIAPPITWVTCLCSALAFSFAAWLLTSKVQVGRDRYWQSERWTLYFTALGGFMVLLGIIGLERDQTHGFDYLDLAYFLGGSYTTFMVGVFTMTWAWTSRTIMFMMIRRYEKEAATSSETICFACGYDLLMLTTEECPECGMKLSVEMLEKIRASKPSIDHAESRSTTR